MSVNQKPSFFTLLLMISFASVNAVLFTPALPNIAKFFSVSSHVAQHTIIWFLIGYALGQLIYGPIANRFGRKPALYFGIGLQIISSFLCVFAGVVDYFSLLILGRFFLALGSGVGLKMAFTLVSECYEPNVALRKIAYLMLSFAITPGLSVAVGGVLNAYYGWQSCFYAGILYGVIFLILTFKLPETQTQLQYDAFQSHHLIQAYWEQFKNKQLMSGGSLMGCSTCFVYVFAAVAPFVAINLLKMNSAEYGLANLLPALGLAMGAVIAAQLAKKFAYQIVIPWGIAICAVSTIFMGTMVLTHQSPWLALFVPMMLIYIGSSMVAVNASTFAMSFVTDKAHGSAVMNFMNMGLTTLVVLLVGIFPVHVLLLPIIYFMICLMMIAVFFLGFFRNRLY